MPKLFYKEEVSTEAALDPTTVCRFGDPMLNVNLTGLCVGPRFLLAFRFATRLAPQKRYTSLPRALTDSSMTTWKGGGGRLIGENASGLDKH